jgi:two-component system OmpR family response regulator
MRHELMARMEKRSGMLAEPSLSPPRIAPFRAAPHVLLIEDEAGIAEEIQSDLEARGFAVTWADDGSSAVGLVRQLRFDVLIVDRMMPGMDGLSVISTLREENFGMPVLVLSALSAVNEKVRGLKAGGDDYLTKPFAMDELAARVEALLRRPLETRETVLRVGPVTLDLIDREAARDGRPIELLPREFKLLEYLMRRPDQVVTRAMLLEDVWHYRFVPQTNLVDVHIGKLRRKVDAPGEAPLIHSVRGAGFQFGLAAPVEPHS